MLLSHVTNSQRPSPCVDRIKTSEITGLSAISDPRDKLAPEVPFFLTEVPHQLFNEAIILSLFESKVVKPNCFKSVRKRHIIDVLKLFI